MAIHTREVSDRFWIKVNKTDTCWLWTASVTGNGYGQFWDTSKNLRAHRFAFEEIKGEIPEGLSLDHLCRVRACVNPDHLEPVTNQENIARGTLGEIRSAQQLAKTHCPQGHPYSGFNLIIGKTTGHRHCRACMYANNKRAYAAKSAARKLEKSALAATAAPKIQLD